jgi:hypothetical protein
VQPWGPLPQWPEWCRSRLRLDDPAGLAFCLPQPPPTARRQTADVLVTTAPKTGLGRIVHARDVATALGYDIAPAGTTRRVVTAPQEASL